MTTLTLGEAIDRHGVDVLEHLDRGLQVPVLTGLQMQGDVAVVPQPDGIQGIEAIGRQVPREGVAVVRGENGGNTHLLLGDGSVLYAAVESARGTALEVGLLAVPYGATAFLAHPEHGYLGIGPGTYELRRQREQAEEERLVAD